MSDIKDFRLSKGIAEMKYEKPKRRALSGKNAQRRLPIFQTIVIALVLDRFNVPGWAWGIFGTLFTIVFIGSLIDFFTAEDVELK